jgi:hypothetical protein
MGTQWLAASLEQCVCSFYSSHAHCFFGKTSHHPGPSAPLQPRFGSLQLLAFPKAKIAIGREEICECNSHTVHKLLTADWLAPWESDCSWIRIVSSDWLPRYIKAKRPILKIFKMAQYSPDRPCTEVTNACITMNISNICFNLGRFCLQCVKPKDMSVPFTVSITVGVTNGRGMWLFHLRFFNNLWDSLKNLTV